MAQKTDIELQAQRAEIESETGNKANTAARVGQMLEDIIDSKLNKEDVEAGAVVSVNGNVGVVVLDAGDVGADVAGAAASVANALSDHITDTVDAHDASAISNVAAGNISATTVQAAINELDQRVTPSIKLFMYNNFI